MTPAPHVLILGAGAAGIAAATELRRLGHHGPVTIVNGEPHPPYNRTTVNKGLLQGTMSLASVAVPVPEDHATTWLHDTRAVALAPVDRVVELDDGKRLTYDAVLVATGSRPRAIPAPVDAGAAARVTQLRTAADASRLRALLDDAAAHRAGGTVRVAVVGAGLLGSETADSLAAEGAEVTLVNGSPVPLGRTLGRTVADWLRSRHEQHVRTAFGATVTEVAPSARGARLALSTGEAVEADVVVVALGVQPAVEWLGTAGLDLTDGVRADDRLRAPGTSGVYVAGDLARIGFATGPARIEHWGHAMAQGTHAARVIAHDLGLAGEPGAFAVPLSFATRLYGKAVTVLGSRSDAHREVVLAGDVATDAVTVGFADAEGRLSGAVALGSPKVANKLRPLLAAGGTVDEAVALLDAEPVLSAR